MAQDPADADKVMHGQLEGENGLLLMASDTPTGMEGPDVSNISVSLSGRRRGSPDPLLERSRRRCADRHRALTKAPWGDTFGMVTDRFGVTWLVNISGAAG